MKILRFRGYGIHGALTVDINFKETISLIVGINGSGKTTALNLISWILALKLGQLAATEFENLILDFEHKGTELSIKVEKSERGMMLSLTGAAEAYNPLIVPPLPYPAPVNNASEAWVRSPYEALSPDASERPLWEFILSLPRVINITLDRVISVDDGGTAYRTLSPGWSATASKTPLEHVNEIIAATYAKLEARIKGADEKLNEDLLMTSFIPRTEDSVPLNTDKFNESIGKMKKIERDLSTSLGLRPNKLLREYFGELYELWKGFASQRDPASLDLGYLRRETARIDAIQDALNRASSVKISASRQWNRYITTLNDLFGDSGKQIHIARNKRELSFRYTDLPKDAVVRDRGVGNLSSGERQLIVLLTYIAFPPPRSSVMIIDEPELSLHPKWQEAFMASVMSVASKRLQLVIATHSPAVVGGYRDFCVVMPRKPQATIEK